MVHTVCQVPCIIPLRSDNAVLLLHTSDVEQSSQPPYNSHSSLASCQMRGTSEKRCLCLGWEQTNNKLLLTFPQIGRFRFVPILQLTFKFLPVWSGVTSNKFKDGHKNNCSNKVHNQFIHSKVRVG